MFEVAGGCATQKRRKESGEVLSAQRLSHPVAKSMKEAERKPLMASLGDFNRPFRVRPVRYLGTEWWAIDADDTWPGMVMDLRRLGFEAVAVEEEVLVREGGAYEAKMEGPADLAGLKPFPTVNPTIQIHRENVARYTDRYADLQYLDEYDELEDEEDELEPEDLDER